MTSQMPLSSWWCTFQTGKSFSVRKGSICLEMPMEMLKWRMKMQQFKSKLGGQSLCVDDLKEAETAIIRFSQQEKFHSEIEALTSGSGVKRKSTLYRLDPILQDGLIRVGGCLNRAAMPESTKHPVILSKEQHMSALILKHIHDQLGHAGRNHILPYSWRNLKKSDLSKFLDHKCKGAARKIISHCGVRRCQRGKLLEQKMSDLPKDRISPDLPPFTNVEVDYFGPVEVKEDAAWWNAYLRCTASRAVHWEVAYSLDTDSCINALRRFVCKRGQVSHMRSDNGTNFIGAQRELREALAAVDHSKIQRAFLQDGIEWSFNPPAGSHHGGVWERIIRMIRKILTSVLQQQTLDDVEIQKY